MASSNKIEEMEKEDQSSTPIITPDAAPREKLIATAVTFLQNPKVKSSPLWQRKAFLKKKGLTDEEIGIAVDRSGVSEEESGNRAAATSKALSGQAVAVQAPAPQPSVWSNMYHITSSVALASGLMYAAYHFYHRYIKPYIFGLPTPDQRLEKLETSTVQLLQTLKQIQETLSSVQEVVIKQDKLQAISRGSDLSKSKMQNELAIQDIKSEMQSIKGLLLSRKQFPPPPASKPSLPTWQLNDSVSPSSSSISNSDSSSVAAASSCSGQTEGDTSKQLEDKEAKSDELLKSERDDNLSKSDQEIVESKTVQKSNGEPEVNSDLLISDSNSETYESIPMSEEVNMNPELESKELKCDSNSKTDLTLADNNILTCNSELEINGSVPQEVEVVMHETSITSAS